MIREKLIMETERMLDEEGFSYCEYSGCFDLAARRHETLLIKVLTNVDSFQREQSDSLRLLSEKISAEPVVVGIQTRYENLVDDVIYERFKTPAMTLHTFSRIIKNNIPFVRRFRGGKFSLVGSLKLKAARIKSGMSQQQLADTIGVSKKNIYEHEKQDKYATEEFVKSVEKLLNTNISEPVELKAENNRISVSPENSFEKDVGRTLRGMGFVANYVRKAPLNIVASQDVIILMKASVSEKIDLSSIKEFSKISKKPALLITEKESSADVPSITLEELCELSNSRELKRFVKKS